ncbi:HK97 family phage prohead protease [Nocardia asiatica]|uniref:HK97 family phage prohead protease n=1 Tax=Nocardia asiatica TaxID=209252 RepID=UPI0005C185AA|nr:HK97 family phage prohead protease [Nocardia asiatica]
MSNDILRRYASLDGATGRTIHGVAIPYGEVAEVRDGYGPPYKEKFLPGAFTRSIQERGRKVRLMAMHNTRSFPIGLPVTLADTPEGLAVAFRISDTVAGNDALALVRDGTVTGFSVGFVPIRSRTVDGVVERLEASLREVSLVTEPAYEGAQVAGIRSKQQVPRIVTADHARRVMAFLDLLP